MADQEDVPAGVMISLPRPQRPVLTEEAASRRFESLHELLKHTWRDETPVPSHAWIRPVLSTGLKQSEFAAA